MHAEDDDVIMAFGLEKPVFRIVVNTMGTLGAIGYTTKVMPSMTLGPGGEGRSITGDNITVHHLYDVKRMAFERKAPPPEIFASPVQMQGARAPVPAASPVPGSEQIDVNRIEAMVTQILDEMEAERGS